MRYHHVGLPTKEINKKETYNSKYKYYASGYFDNIFGIEKLRFDDESPLPEIIKTIPHIGFVVENFDDYLIQYKQIMPVSYPSEFVSVCFIEVNGAPIELIHFKKPEDQVWPHKDKLKYKMNNGDTELLIYNHFGIKTDSSVDGEINFEKFGLFFTDHENNPFGVQWMRYTDNCKLPQLVKSNSHLGFQVKNLNAALAGRKIIIEPNSPSEGICVAFIEENGLPVELMEYN